MTPRRSITGSRQYQLNVHERTADPARERSCIHPEPADPSMRELTRLTMRNIHHSNKPRLVVSERPIAPDRRSNATIRIRSPIQSQVFAPKIMLMGRNHDTILYLQPQKRAQLSSPNPSTQQEHREGPLPAGLGPGSGESQAGQTHTPIQNTSTHTRPTSPSSNFSLSHHVHRIHVPPILKQQSKAVFVPIQGCHMNGCEAILRWGDGRQGVGGELRVSLGCGRGCMGIGRVWGCWGELWHEPVGVALGPRGAVPGSILVQGTKSVKSKPIQTYTNHPIKPFHHDRDRA